MTRTPRRDAHGRFLPKRRRNPTGAGYLEGGKFHPIRSSPSYDPAQAGDSAREQAIMAWKSNKAYIDGHGNYHIKNDGGRGPIAPWNKAAKRAFPNATALHDAAHGKARRHVYDEREKSTIRAWIKENEAFAKESREAVAIRERQLKEGLRHKPPMRREVIEQWRNSVAYNKKAARQFEQRAAQARKHLAAGYGPSYH